jgi:hypothetical protein
MPVGQRCLLFLHGIRPLCIVGHVSLIERHDFSQYQETAMTNHLNIRRPKSVNRGMSFSDVLVCIGLCVALSAIALPVLAMSNDTAGIAGSKRNLMQLYLAHQMYAADHNGNQWVNAPHDLATFGNTYNEALYGYIQSIGGTSNPKVHNTTGQLLTAIGWAIVPNWDGAAGFYVYPWNLYTMPIHLDDSHGPYQGFGYHRMLNVKPLTSYLSGRTYDPVFFAPKHHVALKSVGECDDDGYEFCDGEGNAGHIYWSSYSFSPAALFHPDVWSEPEGEFVANMNGLFAQYPHAFQVLPFDSVKYADLKTHIMERVWLQNVDPAAGDCTDVFPMTFGSYDGCISWQFNASMASAPVTLFYDGHVRLLPLTEVQEADDQIGVWRRDTPMGFQGYFGGEHAWWGGQSWPGPDHVNPSHHILTNGGILGRDTLGQ